MFDWDDTILPTTMLQQAGYRLDGPDAEEDLKEQLHCLGLEVRKTLEEAAKYGRVIIVTNAENGWVELTTQKFLPVLEREVDDLQIISARSTYELDGTSNPFEWKARAFVDIIENHLGKMEGKVHWIIFVLNFLIKISILNILWRHCLVLTFILNIWIQNNSWIRLNSRTWSLLAIPVMSVRPSCR